MIDGYLLEVDAQHKRVEAEQRAANGRLVHSAPRSSEIRLPAAGLRTLVVAARRCQPGRLLGWLRLRPAAG